MANLGKIRCAAWFLLLATLVLGASQMVFASQISFLGCHLQDNYFAVYNFQVTGINPTDQVTAWMSVQYFAGQGQGEPPYANNLLYDLGTLTSYFYGNGAYQILDAVPHGPPNNPYAPPNGPWPMGAVIQLQLTVQVPNGQSSGIGYDTQSATCNIYP